MIVIVLRPLSEIGIVPRARTVSVGEQLFGAKENTCAVLVAALLDTMEFLSEMFQRDPPRLAPVKEMYVMQESRHSDLRLEKLERF